LSKVIDFSVWFFANLVGESYHQDCLCPWAKEHQMTSFKVVVLAIGLAVLSSVPAWAGSVNTYQVTGPVLEVNSDMIAVQKGKDRWELTRDASTKVNGDLAVGSKVTIQYRMIATEVDVKPAKAKK
jgi:hypothetical protein